MRSTLAFLLLFGGVIGGQTPPIPPPDICTLYKVPEENPCEIDIKWKVHSEVQATATCLEYFPTTFVKGKKKNDDTITCRVEPAYQCKPDPEGKNSETFLMFDKCYFFPKISDNGPFVDGTVPEYLANNKALCRGGKLSVFYSHSHAKFLGMKAHELGIDKLWIGIRKDGKSIETRDMIHAEMWKLIEGDYWDVVSGKDVLKTISDPKIVPADAEYFFMRTRDDQFNKRFQGSFERASKNIKATFACEFEAKFTAHQQWYCDKMRSLGLDTAFDATNVDKPRCLYVSANQYTWDGGYSQMDNNIKGCKEKPSELHTAGLDDGTADKTAYEALKNKEKKLRVAGRRASGDYRDCGVKPGNDDQKIHEQLKWSYFEHKGKVKGAPYASLKWNSDYPKNECADFEDSKSTTLGVKEGTMVDMPPEVHAPAICSLIFFQECENRNPCSSDLECRNSNKFELVTRGTPSSGFFTCDCPGEGKAYTRVDNGATSTCTWKANDECAWFEYHQPVENKPKDSEFASKSSSLRDISRNDMLIRTVVRYNCKLYILGACATVHPNFDLLTDARFGTHLVPNAQEGTLGGDLVGLGASSYWCSCW